MASATRSRSTTSIKLWRALKNNYWPAHYFIDAQGRVRYHHFGEGDYAMQERVIRQLLAEAGRAPNDRPLCPRRRASGAQTQANIATLQSPETYIGYWRADRLVSPGGLLRDKPKTYAAAPLELNDWSFEGRGSISGKARGHSAPERRSTTASTPATCTWCWHRRPASRCVIACFSTAMRAGPDAGVDITADGLGVVKEQRLYQLVRQKGAVRERTFTIEFLDPGAEAFAFTFG